MSNGGMQYRERKLTRPEMARRDELFRQLGKEYYEGAFEDPLPQLLPLFDKLTELLLEPVPVQEERESFRRCPVCGAKLPETASFCEECGNPIAAGKKEKPRKAPRFCPTCGNELRPDAKYCGRCGEKVD